MEIRVSAIVPAFNEERTIAEVLNVLLESPLINEIICINDGSSDRTADIAKSFGGKINFLDFKVNRGKGFALARGIEAAKGNIVIFFDADLITLSQKHINSLLEPIITDDRVDGVLGDQGFSAFTVYSSLRTPFTNLTGLRAYKKAILLPHIKNMEDKRFGIELYLSHLFDSGSANVIKVSLVGIRGLEKHEKRPPFQAAKEYTKMFAEIVETKKDIEMEGYRRATKKFSAKKDNLVTNFNNLKRNLYYFRRDGL